VRVLFPARCDGAWFPIADGGRFCDSSRCRAVIPEVFGVFAARPFIAGVLCDGVFPAFERWFIAPFPERFIAPFMGALPVRPALNLLLLIVRTGMCEAARAGAVRAITERFWTAADGLATPERMLAWPSLLFCVGLSPRELVTCAPFSAAGVRCTAPRLMACPWTNALREATVTARTLWAFAKLMLRMFLFKMFLSRKNVLRSLIRSKNS
jgi:hypothetical protein